jgi:hypothetical protein
MIRVNTAMTLTTHTLLHFSRRRGRVFRLACFSSRSIDRPSKGALQSRQAKYASMQSWERELSLVPMLAKFHSEFHASSKVEAAMRDSN